MSEEWEVNGLVLSQAPSRENDRRLIILTDQLGRISAFAGGAAKSGNVLAGAARPFSFGKMTIRRGNGAYRLVRVQGLQFFPGLSENMEASLCGQYFLELANECAQENQDETALLKLTVYALLALEKARMPVRLVRLAYELKLLAVIGVCPESPEGECLPGTERAWKHVLASPPEELFSFTLSDEVAAELAEFAEKLQERELPRRPRSLAILREMGI